MDERGVSESTMSSGTAGSKLRVVPVQTGQTHYCGRELQHLPAAGTWGFCHVWLCFFEPGNWKGRAGSESVQQLYPQMLMKNILILKFPISSSSSGNLAVWLKAKMRKIIKISAMFMLTSQLAIISHFQFWICLQVDNGNGLPNQANFQSKSMWISFCHFLYQGLYNVCALFHSLLQHCKSAGIQIPEHVISLKCITTRPTL